MMLFNNEETFPYEIENGIVIDYLKHRFIMVMKDDTWSDFEIQGLLKKKFTLSFLYERICAIFLFSIEDCIEISDASFDIHLCDFSKEILSNQDCYDFEIYLIDKQCKIKACKHITLTKKMSNIIKQYLQIQMEATYDEEGFNKALMKIQSQYEPFELDEFAKVKGKY